MSMPLSIRAYEEQWGKISRILTEQGHFVLPLGSVKLAKSTRLKFYGFRNALEKHDPGNPWLGALMETQATVSEAGELILTRSPLSALLRGILENTVIDTPKAAGPEEVPQRVPYHSPMEDTLLQWLNEGKAATGATQGEDKSGEK